MVWTTGPPVVRTLATQGLPTSPRTDAGLVIDRVRDALVVAGGSAVPGGPGPPWPVSIVEWNRIRVRTTWDDSFSDHVNLSFESPDLAGRTCRVLKRTPETNWAQWETIGPETGTSMGFSDYGVDPDHRYGYRLILENGSVVDEVWVGTRAATPPVPPPGGLGIHPNPTTGSFQATIRLETSAAPVSDLYDLNGRTAGHWESGLLPPGIHSLAFGPLDVPAGVYWLRIRAGGQTSTRRVAIVR